jgi:hypothetical protein
MSDDADDMREKAMLEDDPDDPEALAPDPTPPTAQERHAFGPCDCAPFDGHSGVWCHYPGCTRDASDPVHAPEPERRVDGTWPEHCEQRAFVSGAKWWMFRNSGATPFGSERDAMEEAAINRYGEPTPAPAPLSPEREREIREMVQFWTDKCGVMTSNRAIESCRDLLDALDAARKEAEEARTLAQERLSMMLTEANRAEVALDRAEAAEAELAALRAGKP